MKVALAAEWNIWSFPPRNARTTNSWADLGIVNIDIEPLRSDGR